MRALILIIKQVRNTETQNKVYLWKDKLFTFQIDKFFRLVTGFNNTSQATAIVGYASAFKLFYRNMECSIHTGDRRIRTYSSFQVLIFPYFQARIWLASLGFTTAFGAMFAKIWRVYVIFTNAKLRKKVRRETKETNNNNNRFICMTINGILQYCKSVITR